MGGQKYNLKDYAAKAREAAADGIVLLKNEGGVLPLRGKSKVALFGRTQLNYYKGGYGSGGMVNTAYVTGIYEALKENPNIVLNENVRAAYEEWEKSHPFDMGAGWAQEPHFQEEMKLNDALVAQAAAESDTALILIGRIAGEDKDNTAEEGSYLLTGTELDMLRKVCGKFSRTVVLLNVGNIIDMKWMRECNPSAVLYVWQGGQEGGNSVTDVLTGAVNPSGRLTDTVAADISDYPSTANFGGAERNFYAEDIYVGYRYFETFAGEKVLFPFGHGLSYTTFERKLTDVRQTQEGFVFTVRVTNTGGRAGKHSALLFVEAPQGRLGKPARSLCAFAKTGCLKPGESEELSLVCGRYEMSSYDDGGAAGHKSCYVLEGGAYRFYLGGDVREAVCVHTYEQKETEVVQQLTEAAAPTAAFRRLRPEIGADGAYTAGYEPAPLRTGGPDARRAAALPQEIPYTGDRGKKLSDVADGKLSMNEFIGQLSEEDLAAIVRAEGMCPENVTPGIAGAFGGVTPALRAFGIPEACCADGPSGIRMDCGTKAFLLPIGTCLACSFDEKLVEELYSYEGMELRKNHIDSLLGPGMNLHRNPLNGRNFEYFSEDPYVTGRIAAAELRGMNKSGVTGTIKHFACNNQEFRRSFVNSVVSERALRELYLRCFEIPVRQGAVRLIMSSYNPINGLYASSNYDLLTTILRGEWGFDGAVMTDWYAMGNDEGKPGVTAYTEAMVRAQNDLYMVVPDAAKNSAGDTSVEAMKAGRTAKAEFQRTAANICRVLMTFPAFAFSQGKKSELDMELEKCKTDESDDLSDIRTITAESGIIVIPPELLDYSTGKTKLFRISTEAAGRLQLVFECASEVSFPLAQIPVSVFKNNHLVRMLTLTGSDTEWREERIDLSENDGKAFFLKIHFGMGGIKIRNCRIIPAEKI